MTNIVSRIEELAINQNITLTALESKIGASKGVLSRALAKKTDIQSKWIQKIVENYPEVNSEWLLTGKGHMFKQTSHINFLKTVNEEQKQKEQTISLETTSNYQTNKNKIITYKGETFIIPLFKEADYLTDMQGDAMKPTYNSGDLIACKHLALDTFLQWNKIYVLNTVQGALIKRVRKGSDDNHILLISDNEKYPSFELSRSEITSLAIVLGVIKLE